MDASVLIARLVALKDVSMQADMRDFVIEAQDCILQMQRDNLELRRENQRLRQRMNGVPAGPFSEFASTLMNLSNTGFAA